MSVPGGHDEGALIHILAAITSGVVIRDAAGGITYANEAAERILNLSRDQLLEITPHEPGWQLLRSDGSYLPAAERPTARVLQTGEPQCGAVISVALPGGERRSLQVDAVPVFGADGSVQHVVSTFHDITELARATVTAEELARLRQDQAVEAEAMAAVSAALAGALEPASVYQVILQQAARVLPFDHAEIVLYQDGWAVSAASLGEPSVPPGTLLVPLNTSTSTWHALSQGKVEYLADTADVPGWLDCPPWVGPSRIRSSLRVPLKAEGALLGTFGLNSFTPRFYAAGQVQTAAAFGERAAQALRNARLYVAEQERARAAHELAELRSTFVAGVSHELRTPLTAIVGFGELLQARWSELSDEHRQERIAQIVLAANRQMRLVEDLLLVSKLGTAQLAPPPRMLALASLVQQAAMEVRGAYPGQRITLEGAAGLQVIADADDTMQILTNLLDNAAKYSPEGSPISVTWSCEAQMAVIRVRDKGPGITEQGREYLFTRFGRIPGSRSRAGRVGTGLGLYISRALVEAMNGTLELEATGPEGSTFRLTLPIAPA